MIGTKLAHYEITSHLGTGGMGEVYQATDSKLGRSVAIKLLPEAFDHDSDRTARFEREARVLASLNHPNIAVIYGVEESSGRKFLVMELVPGETLEDCIKRSPIPVEETLRIAAQISEALEAAHEKGVVHRDLKPANIKITADGKVKVLDFGLAKAFAADGNDTNLPNSPTLSMAATNAGIIIGTAAYMSPEQARGLTADPRSDIFSLGCVLYEMLTARQAFHGETVSDILASVLKSDPDFRLLPAKLNPKIAELLRRCLEKTPKRRWHAAGDVRIEIESILADPRGVSAGEPPVVMSTPLWRRAVPLLVAVVLTSLFLGAGSWYFKPQTSTPTITKFPLPLGPGQQPRATSRTELAISADGTQIVYEASGRLYHRFMSEMEARPIPGTDNSPAPTSPIFSPDGRSVAFYSTNDRAIKKIAVTGGTAVPLCPADNPYGMSWGEDGILFGQGDKGIFRVSKNGGQPEPLVRVKSGELAQGPQMLPGGRAMLFTLASGAPVLDTWDKAQIVVQVLKSGERRTLVIGGSDARYLPTGHLVYAVSGNLFAIPLDLGSLKVNGGSVPVLEGVRRASTTGAAQFSLSDTGSLIYLPGPLTAGNSANGLALLDRKGIIEPLKVPPKAYGYPRVSPDGKHIALGIEGGKDANVWIQDLAVATAIRQLTLGGANRYPIWSEDGVWIAFQSDREGDLGIFRQRADGTGTVERLTRPEQGVAHFPDSWQSGGQRFSYTAVKGSEATVRIFSLTDKKDSVFAEMPLMFVARSAFSHDGKWLAYQSNETGTNQIFVQPFPATGTKHTVVAGSQPFWSPDGKELFYNAGPGRWSVVSITTRPTFVFSDPAAVTSELRNSAPRQFPRQSDIMPDGRLIGIIDPDQAQTGIPSAPQIDVVLNWFEDLKQRMSAR